MNSKVFVDRATTSPRATALRRNTRQREILGGGFESLTTDCLLLSQACDTIVNIAFHNTDLGRHTALTALTKMRASGGLVTRVTFNLKHTSTKLQFNNNLGIKFMTYFMLQFINDNFCKL